MEKKNDSIKYELADIIIEKPHVFSVGRKQYKLYPVTLAKSFLLKRYIDKLPIDIDVLRTHPYFETLRLVGVNKKLCCQIVAIHATPNTYRDLYNSKVIAEKRNAFCKMTDENLASLLIYALNSDKTEQVMQYLGLDKERERMNKVIEVKAKNNKNNLTFGGKSIFGLFIGQLREMGYTDNEILYERGYSFLRLMLADKITSIYVTDEEYKVLPADADPNCVDGNDPSSWDKLKARLKVGGVKFND